MPRLFINCDWGTSHLRVRAVTRDSLEVVAERKSDDGVARLAAGGTAELGPRRFAAALSAAVDALAPSVGPRLAGTPIIISGMASSSIGWQELDYARLPLSADGQGLAWRELEPLAMAAGSHRMLLVSGARTDTDVMRGEETQALGIFELPLAAKLASAAILIMPGTHSKHLTIADREIRDFRTFMTGELFEAISAHTILRYSLAPPDDEQADRDAAAFRAGVDEARRFPLSAALFRVRTRQLLDHESPPANRAFLSGVLIGAELAYLTTASRPDQTIVLAASGPLALWYREGLDALQLTSRAVIVPPADVDRLSALGQAVLLRRIDA